LKRRKKESKPKKRVNLEGKNSFFSKNLTLFLIKKEDWSLKHGFKANLKNVVRQ